LDQFYTAAVLEESEQTLEALNAYSRMSIGDLNRVKGRGVGRIMRNLGSARLELQRVFRGRGLHQQFDIETGGDRSFLGGALGTLGL
jgi:hypothetical protein